MSEQEPSPAPAGETEPGATSDADRLAEQPTPPRTVTLDELRRGLDLETQVVHKLRVDLGFVFSS